MTGSTPGLAETQASWQETTGATAPPSPASAGRSASP
jgi:hypothetical protein